MEMAVKHELQPEPDRYGRGGDHGAAADAKLKPTAMAMRSCHGPFLASNARSSTEATDRWSKQRSIGSVRLS